MEVEVYVGAEVQVFMHEREYAYLYGQKQYVKIPAAV